MAGLKTNTNNLQEILDELYNKFFGDIFSFKIDNNTYQARQRMTWEDWCNSAYNTLGYHVVAGSVCSYDGTSYVAQPSLLAVSSNSVIKNNYAYIHLG